MKILCQLKLGQKIKVNFKKKNKTSILFLVNKSANRFASRLKEYDSMENDLKSMKQKRSELSRSLRMLDSGRDGSSRHNARQRKDQLEIELDAVDREIHSLKKGLTQ